MKPGIVILGGAHGALALARSAGAAGMPVTLMSRDSALPGWSRFITRKVTDVPVEPAALLAELKRMARDNGLTGAVLVPASDREVSFVARHRAELAEDFEVPLPDWEALRWLCEKPLLYRRAEALGIDFPKTYRFSVLAEAETAAINFPVVLKPNMGGAKNRLTLAKVIRADDRASFLAELKDAASEMALGDIVVQELVPGGGECQFSYCALWRDGAPVAEFTARRARQYPVDFGYTSTYVVTVDDPGIVEPSRKLLASIRHSGLVEIEYKLDRRDGSFKVLDVNPRPWSWMGLAKAAGIDLGALMINAEAAPPGPVRSGAAWMYLLRDAAASVTLMQRGILTAGDYVRSFGLVRAWATFAASDPMPGVIDLPVTIWRVITRRLLRLR